MTANEYGIIKDIIEDAYTALRYNQNNIRDNDAYRSQHTATRFTTCGMILQHFQLDVKFGTWMDGEIEKIGFMSIEGFRIVENGEWDYEQSRLLGDVLRHKVDA